MPAAPFVGLYVHWSRSCTIRSWPSRALDLRDDRQVLGQRRDSGRGPRESVRPPIGNGCRRPGVIAPAPFVAACSEPCPSSAPSTNVAPYRFRQIGNRNSTLPSMRARPPNGRGVKSRSASALPAVSVRARSQSAIASPAQLRADRRRACSAAASARADRADSHRRHAPNARRRRTAACAGAGCRRSRRRRRASRVACSSSARTNPTRVCAASTDRLPIGR